MDVEATLELAKRLILAQTEKQFNDLQTYILQGALEGKTLREIAECHSYNESHVKEVSTKLWKILSSALGESVTKRNVRSILKQYLYLENQKPQPPALPETPPQNDLEHDINNYKYQRGMWIPNLRCRQVWGRDQFREEVLQRLSDRQEDLILSLCGSAGYGKTEVACLVAKAAVEKNLFADVLWVKARDTEFLDGLISSQGKDESLSCQQLLQEIAHQLDGCSVNQVHQRLKQEKRLIILDNAETAQLEDILPQLNQMLNPSRVLLTSRRQTHGAYVGLINIPALEKRFADQLLQDEAKRKDVPALLEASPEQLDEIYELSCGAPLALHFIVGRVLDDGRLEPVLSALKEASGDVEKIYEFSLNTAWQRISEATKNLLYYMGNADAGVTGEELLGTSQVEETDWNLAQRELKRWYLMEEEKDAKGKARYNLHPWVRRSLRGGLVAKWQERSLSEWEDIARRKYGLVDLDDEEEPED